MKVRVVTIDGRPRGSIPMFRKFAALLLVASLGTVLLAGPSSAAASPEDHPTPAAADGDHHGDSGAQPNILELKPTLAIATLIVFLVLLAVLRKTAWGPLMQALHDREHHLEHTLQETEKARDEAAQLLEAHKLELAKAADQVRAMIDDARTRAQSLKDDLIRQAQEEAEAGRLRVQRDIEAAKDRALTEIWSSSANLAVNVASKVLPRELGDQDHRRLVEQALAELPQANGVGSKS